MRSIPEDYLFCHGDWFAVAEEQKKRLVRDIEGLAENRILNAVPGDLCNYYVSEYVVHVPVLDEASIEVDRREAQIDVSRDPMRFDYGEGRPIYVTGTTINVFVPFSGDAGVFKIRPTTYTTSFPRAVVQGQQLVLSLTGTNLNGDQLKLQIEAALREIKQYLGWLANDARGLNSQLEPLARSTIERRRQKFLADRDLVASLGYPLKMRADAPQTFRAPEVRRRVRLAPPAASAAPFKPEPALSMEDYEHILSVMENMALVMERSPSAFRTMGEEDLRQHFLVQLNGHYEGNATGETFNYEGKTDILIRSGGRNLFIAECKYSDGPKKLIETIDQLLGYLSWRDTKAAIVLFNRQKDFSRVAGSIRGIVKAHPNFKRELAHRSETSTRYVLRMKDDPNREMTLSVLAFDVPQPAG